MGEELLLIGKITKPHGIGGKLRVASYAGDLETFQNLSGIYLKKKDGKTDLHQIASASQGNGFVILELDGITDRSMAEGVSGSDLFMKREELRELPEGEYYHIDLIGLDVITEEGVLLGRISEVFPTGSNDVFVVKKGKTEHLIPVIKDVIREVDIEGGKVIVHLLDNLIEEP